MTKISEDYIQNTCTSSGHFQTAVNFQKNSHKTAGGVAHTMCLLLGGGGGGGGRGDTEIRLYGMHISLIYFMFFLFLLKT